MLYLFKLEWLKQRKFIIFRVMVLFYLIALPAILLMGKSIDFGTDPPPFLPSTDVFYIFPTVWIWLGYIGNWLTFFFLGFLAVLMVTNEQNNRTLRQNIITGLSRKEYFWSKVLFIVFLSLCATLYFSLCALTFGFLHTETIYLSTVLKNADYIYRYFLMCLGYMSFGLLLGILIRRTGIALFLYITYIMVLESILRYTQLYFFKNRSMHFYPMNAIEDLIPIPFSKMAEGFMQQNGFNLFLSPTEAIIASSIYITLFLILAYQWLKRADL